MSEGDGFVYNNAKEMLMNGDVDLETDVMKLTLHTGYSPDIDADDVWADISATEYPTADGYTVGGQTISGQSVVQDDANNRATFDFDDETWVALGPLTPATPSHMVLRASGLAGEPLIAYWDMGSTPTDGNDFIIIWPSVAVMLLA